jgi:hypothetical protein
MSLKENSDYLKEEEDTTEQIEYYRLLWHESKRFIYYINSGGYFEKCDINGLKLENYEDNITRVNDYMNRNNFIATIEGEVTYIRKAIIERFSGIELSEGKNFVLHLDGDLRNCAIDNLLVLSNRSEYDAYLKGKPLYSYLKEEKRKLYHDLKSFIKALGLDNEKQLRAYYSKYKRGASTNGLKWLDKYKITLLELGVENYEPSKE